MIDFMNNSWALPPLSLSLSFALSSFHFNSHVSHLFATCFPVGTFAYNSATSFVLITMPDRYIEYDLRCCGAAAFSCIAYRVCFRAYRQLYTQLYRTVPKVPQPFHRISIVFGYSPCMDSRSLCSRLYQNRSDIHIWKKGVRKGRNSQSAKSSHSFAYRILRNTLCSWKRRWVYVQSYTRELRGLFVSCFSLSATFTFSYLTVLRLS